MSRVTGESVHLTSTHRPFDTRVFQKECRSLVNAGYRVTLIVPHTEDVIVEGVQIRAVPVPQNGRARLLKTTRLVYKAALKEDRKAIFHFHDAELLPFMLWLKLKRRCVIYDAHEDTPQQIKYQHWIPRWLRPLVSLFMFVLEAMGGMLFDRLITAEPVVAKRFNKNKTIIIHNYPLLGEFTQIDALPYQERPFHAAYIGGISEVRGIREMIYATQKLQDPFKSRLLLAGAFYPASLEKSVQSMTAWDAVDYHGWISRYELAQHLGNVRVGLVILYPTQKYMDSYPTKLFEYMAAGLPVIASDFPQFRNLIEDVGCALFVDPKDPAALADAMRWIFEHPEEAEMMGQRGKQTIEERFNWKAEGDRLIDVYKEIASSCPI